MTERSDRLRQAMTRMGMKQRDAVDRWGWNPNTLRSNLNGNVDFSFKRAQVYGHRLKVRPEWLYAAEGPMEVPPSGRGRPPIEVPVISWVSAGKLAAIDIDQEEPLATLTVSGLASSGRYVATEVVGDSMDRVSPDGSTAIFNVNDRTPVDGGFYVFSLDGQTTYKRFYAEPVPRLEPFSTNPANRTIFIDKRLKWECVGRVVRSLIDLD